VAGICSMHEENVELISKLSCSTPLESPFWRVSLN
jgi:hypothetical protein